MRRRSRVVHWSIGALLLTILCTPPALSSARDGDEKFVVIRAGQVVTLAGETVSGGEIIVVDGKIRLVGKNLDYPKSATVIEARDEVVMPGMIHPRTRWQLPSYSRSGLHADRSPAKELYYDDIDFEPLLKAGFTTVCFYPAGSGLPGPGIVYRTAGKGTSRELGPAYLRVTMSAPGRDKKTLREAIKKARSEIEKVEKARKEWEQKQKKLKEEAAKEGASDKGDKPGAKPAAKKKDVSDEGKDKDKDKDQGDGDQEEKKGKDDKQEESPAKQGETKAKPEEKKPAKFTPPKIDPAVAPLVDWIRDQKGLPLLFELSRASDLVHLDSVLEQAKELPGTRFYLPGVYSPDYHFVCDKLGDRKAIVLTTPQIRQLPSTVVRYNLPAELNLAGCTVALLPSSDSTSELKSVRSRLAELVRSGLSRNDALQAVTINAAKLLGMDDRLGTIEKGKDADVIFLDGDPLATGTRVTRVMTFGEIAWEASKSP